MLGDCRRNLWQQQCLGVNGFDNASNYSVDIDWVSIFAIIAILRNWNGVGFEVFRYGGRQVSSNNGFGVNLAGQCRGNFVSRRRHRILAGLAGLHRVQFEVLCHCGGNVCRENGFNVKLGNNRRGDLFDCWRNGIVAGIALVAFIAFYQLARLQFNNARNQRGSRLLDQHPNLLAEFHGIKIHCRASSRAAASAFRVPSSINWRWTSSGNSSGSSSSAGGGSGSSSPTGSSAGTSPRPASSPKG